MYDSWRSQKHRFLFTPLEGLYLVLISSKSSNIIEDQQTMKLLYSICSKVCSEGITEGIPAPM